MVEARQKIEISSRQAGDPYLAPFYEAGNGDGDVTFEELEGETISLPKGSVAIDSRDGFHLLVDVVSQYQKLIEQGAAQSDHPSLWGEAKKLAGNYFRHGATDTKYLYSIQIDEDRTILSFFHGDFSDYGKLVFSEKDIHFESVGAGNDISLERMPEIPLLGLIHFSADQLNDSIEKEIPSLKERRKLRRTLFKNVDRVRREMFVRLNNRDKRTETRSDSVTVKKPSLNYQAPFQIEAQSTLLLSERPLTQEQVGRLRLYFQELPETVKDLFLEFPLDKPEMFTVAIVSPESIKSVSGLRSTMAAYDDRGKIMYLPDSFLDPDFHLKSQAIFDHEISHAILDWLVPDNDEFEVDLKGLMLDEFERLQQQKREKGDLFEESSVSEYAGREITEFAAETLTAYFRSYDDVLTTGYFASNMGGFITREELIQKHPRLYQAYEVFFAKDSPVRFQTFIFRDEHYPLINEVLERHQGDLAAAREELFRVLASM